MNFLIVDPISIFSNVQIIISHIVEVRTGLNLPFPIHGVLEAVVVSSSNHGI